MGPKTTAARTETEPEPRPEPEPEPTWLKCGSEGAAEWTPSPPRRAPAAASESGEEFFHVRLSSHVHFAPTPTTSATTDEAATDANVVRTDPPEMAEKNVRVYRIENLCHHCSSHVALEFEEELCRCV
eukprot:SAG31_NODE_17523_length_667_cov_1.401408_2_plen_128_part_00